MALEKEVKDRVARGLRTIINKGGATTEKTALDRQLDDIFDISDESDTPINTDDDGETAREKRKTAFKRGNTFHQFHEDESASDGYETYRKNNVEEDTRIAETIIQGMAEYTEFKVQGPKKVSKRRRQKQFVINAHMVRLCIMRCFHPEKLMQEIRSFIAYFLGQAYTEPPSFDF